MNTSFISPILPKKEITSATKRLHVFNPEHDLALGVGKGPYTPPAEVVRLRKEKSLLPALYADNGDFILLRDHTHIQEISPLTYYDIYRSKNLIPVFLNELSDFSDNFSKIQPWGWDHAIIKDLKDNGALPDLLPTETQIEDLRNLSHRRTTLPFREMMADLLNNELINLPQELNSIREVEQFLNDHPLAYFKAPWSSSGRGIVVSDHISPKGLKEWCHGVIKHQGSVMAEPAWDRIFDFATEWLINNYEVTFLGVSIFETSSRGKYHGNIYRPQEELYKLIKEKAKNFSEEVIFKQQIAIKKLIAPKYSGYLGIDMLVDSHGNINPCVELNLRMTMGHVALQQKNL